MLQRRVSLVVEPFPHRTSPVRWLEVIAEQISDPEGQSRAAACGHVWRRRIGERKTTAGMLPDW